MKLYSAHLLFFVFLLQGVISVARPLDREWRSSYTLFVTAMDNPSDQDNQRTNQTKAITINIDDVNDEDPVFKNIEPNTKYTVLENAVEGHLVITVTAEDEDVGENARLSYTLTAEDPTIANVFVIKTVPTSIGGVPKFFGDIEVNGNLLGKVDDYRVNVIATDHGVPPRSVDINLIISVVDVNLHQPVFINPTGPRNTIQTDEVRLIQDYFEITSNRANHEKMVLIAYANSKGPGQTVQMHSLI